MNVINTKLLIDWMNKTGLSYSEISRLSNISRNTIYNVCSGKTCPSIVVMQSLAKTLKMTEAIFFDVFFPELKLKNETKIKIEG